ncbi:hypothetical protein [Campylobacter corcagiensis]|uniref:Uncharacterized protein n=1 Tax=Campylobacter corcagiensis TaxID=1448857 RepID=A0A7M1LFW8_9BACT|nr:hypothetical protein [Campylobacter corcagiensis]QKF64627.1 hypothetical protein CCORG_0770 [Campylobacter corcagiensis]QOQ87201.1 hypothetical protein IMC76_08325 [Campylobacter corcagiensis]
MKTSVFFKNLLATFTLVLLSSSLNADGLSPGDYGGTPCPNGAAFCPPAEDGSIMGNLNLFYGNGRNLNKNECKALEYKDRCSSTRSRYYWQNDHCWEDTDCTGKGYQKLMKTGVPIYYQTNIPSKDGRVGSFSSFKTDPSYSSLVYGDYAVAGESVLKFKNAVGRMDFEPAEYEKDGGSDFELNGKKSTMYLPASIKPEYIKYARVTWVGSIHTTNFTNSKVANNVFELTCTNSAQQLILKSDKKQLSPNWIRNICENALKSRKVHDVDCGAIPSMVENGVYDPVKGNDYFIDLKKYNDPGNYVTYVENGEKPVSNKPKAFFTCKDESVSPWMKKVNLKPISSDAIKQCKEKFPNADCDKMLGNYEDYYYPVSESKPAPVRIDIQPDTTKLLKEDVASRKTSLRQMCNEKFGNNPDCNRYSDDPIYKPYTQEELEGLIVEKKEIIAGPTVKVPKVTFLCFDKSSLHGYSTGLGYAYHNDKMKNTLENVKSDCKQILKNNTSLCDKLTSDNIKGYENSLRFAGTNNPDLAKQINTKMFPSIKLECPGAGRDCSYIDGYRISQKMCRLQKVEEVSTPGTTERTTEGFVCDLYPERCEANLPSWKNISLSGGVGEDTETFCKENPSQCVQNVKTCKAWEYGTDNSSYCDKNKDKCEMANFCMGYNYISTKAPAKNTNSRDNLNIAELARKELGGYRNMSLKVGNGETTKVEARDEDIYYTMSLDNTQANGQGSLWFIYSASADVTDYVKNALSMTNNSSSGDIWELPIIGGDVLTSDGEVINGRAFWHLGREFKSGWLTANFGSYLLTIVYSNDNVAKEMPDKKSKTYQFYKPKNVTIFNGFAALNDPDINNPQGAYLDFDIGGFYTPRQKNYDAKATVYAASNANYFNPGDKFAVSYKGNPNDLRKAYNSITNGYNFSGGRAIVKPGDNDVSVIDPNKWRSISINSYILNKFKNPDEKTQFMVPEQTNIHFQYGVLAHNTSGEQTYPSVIAFSTDLYVPEVCYYSTVYNMAGKSSRGKDGFVVTPNETLRNQVYFTIHKNSDSYDSEGLVIVPKLSRNLVYIDNSTKVSNPGDHDPTGFDNLESIEDNKASRANKYYNKLEGKNYELYLGKGAGVKVGNSISGGTLTKDTKAYVEFKTRIGGYYEEPVYKYSFSLKGVTMDYQLQMQQCPNPIGSNDTNIVELVPVEGLIVVNENYEKKGDDVSLYTQVANEPFNLKLVYDQNITDMNDTRITNILGDDKLAELLCGKGSNPTDQGCAAKIEKFEKDRAEQAKEIKKTDDERIETQKELYNKQSELSAAEKTLQNAQTAYNEAKNKYDANKDDSGLEAAYKASKKALDDAKKKVDDLNSKINDLEQNLEDIKKKLEKAKKDLQDTEAPIKDEFVNRFSRLDGVFVTTLTTNSALAKTGKATKKEQCDYVVKNSYDSSSKEWFQFKHFQDFAMGDDKAKKVGEDGTITLINDDKSKDHAYNSYEFFSDENSDKPIIDMKKVDIGLARKDYTFAVSYIPSGQETLTNCQYDCIKNNTKDGIRDMEKIKACQSKCSADNDQQIKDEVYRINICNSDEFAVRPAYFKLSKKVKDLYTAGDSKLASDFKSNIYPSDKDGNYVLGYDALLQPSTFDKNKSQEEQQPEPSTIFAQLSTKECLNEKVANVYLKGDEIFYAKSSTDVSNSAGVAINTLWDRSEKSSNNLIADFKYEKDLADEIKTYNSITTKDNLKRKANNSKKYSDVSLGKLGALNYYNIGYARMRLTDSAWTADDRADFGFGCIEGNYTYKTKNNKGKVGCYIGMDNDQKFDLLGIGSSVVTENRLDNQDLVLKFTYDTLKTDIVSLDDATTRSNDGRVYEYTYFNDFEASKRMGADMTILSKAFVPTTINGKEHNITTTLYNGGCYSRDMIFGLDFTFDCNDNADKISSANRCGKLYNRAEFCKNNILDSRCYKNVTLLAEQKADYDADDNLTKGIKFSASGGIEHFTDKRDKYKKIENINFVKNSGKGSITNVFDELENMFENNKTTPYRLPVFVAPKEEFINGENNGTIKINFARSVKTPLNPKVIYAQDFKKNSAVDHFEEGLDTDNEITEYEIKTDGIKAKNIKFSNLADVSNKSPLDFYYGYVNAEKNQYTWDIDYVEGIRDEQNVDVYSMIYLDYNGSGDISPKLSLIANDDDLNKNVTGVNDKLYYVGDKNPNRTNFYQNPSELYHSGSKDFVIRYIENSKPAGSCVRSYEVSGLNPSKSMETKDVENDNGVITSVRQFQKLNLSSDVDKWYVIEVETEPWLLYTGEESSKCGVTSTKYNYFEFILSLAKTAPGTGRWGGVGTTKSGDILGNYLNYDENGTGNDIQNSQQILTPRTNW